MQSQQLNLKTLLILLMISLQLVACKRNGADPAPAAPAPVSYLALGDSYTIGESVSRDGRWPVQLVATLRANGTDISDPEIIAQTGWTTADLQQALDARSLKEDWGLVSLLIGVNNQFQGRSLSEYRTEYTQLLDQTIALAEGRSDRVFVVSIPDYGYTPFGSPNQASITAKLAPFNEACREITATRNVAWYDITPISTEGLDRNDYVANDGLHPSAEQYADWVASFQAAVTDQLKN